MTQLLAGGKYANVKLGIGAFPVYSASCRAGSSPEAAGVYISNKVPALDQAASWQFLSYLMNTQSAGHLGGGDGLHPGAQVLGADGDGAAPVGHRTRATRWPTTKSTTAPTTPATSGSVIGPYADVRTDVLNAEISMYTQGVSPAAAVKAAAQNVNSSISSYNSRLSSSRPSGSIA